MIPENTGPAAVIVLAAGAGTRMKSRTPKILHEIGGRSMVVPSSPRAAIRPRPTSISWLRLCTPVIRARGGLLLTFPSCPSSRDQRC